MFSNSLKSRKQLIFKYKSFSTKLNQLNFKNQQNFNLNSSLQQNKKCFSHNLYNSFYYKQSPFIKKCYFNTNVSHRVSEFSKQQVEDVIKV